MLLFQQHRKVLDKGKPEDVMPAIKGTKVSVNAFVFFPIFGDGQGVVEVIFLTSLPFKPAGATTNCAFIRNVQQIRRKSKTHIQTGAGSAVDRD